MGIDDKVMPLVEKEDYRVYHDTISIKQDACPPNVLASISLERVNFGNMPVNAILRQVVVVQNNDQDQRLSFKWIVPDYWPPNTIEITPETGRLNPGECQVCKVIFTPDSCPRMWEYDIICEYINETELDAYNQQVQILKTAINEGRALSNLPQLHSKSNPGDLNRKYTPLPSINSTKSKISNSDYIDVHGQDNFNDSIFLLN